MKQWPVVALVLGIALAPVAARGVGQSAKELPGAQEAAASPADKCAVHGGIVTKVGYHYLETVFAPKSISVYSYSEQQTPEPVDGTRGIVTVKFRGNRPAKVLDMLVDTPGADEKNVYYCSMHPDQVSNGPGKCPKCGMALVPQNRLRARADFSRVSPDTMGFYFKLSGLPGHQAEASYTVIFKPPAEWHNIPTPEVEHKDRNVIRNPSAEPPAAPRKTGR